MGILKSGESIPMNKSGLSSAKKFFSSFLNLNNFLNLSRGSMIPMTDISSITKNESNPWRVILEPPTPINSTLESRLLIDSISLEPRTSPDTSPATMAIFNGFLLLLANINEICLSLKFQLN